MHSTDMTACSLEFSFHYEFRAVLKYEIADRTCADYIIYNMNGEKSSKMHSISASILVDIIGKLTSSEENDE